MKNIAYITREDMIEVDRQMIDEYHIELLQMMEHAGYELANFVRERYDGNTKIIVLAGGGGNGGGVLVACRRLVSWGYQVDVALSSKNPKGVTQKQIEILEKVGVTFLNKLDNKYDLLIDGIVGYSLSGELRGKARDLVVVANTLKCSKISLDLPSGMDANEGVCGECVAADYTLTLALPKIGLQKPQSQSFVGELYIVDIGIVPQIYDDIRIKVDNIFKNCSIIGVSSW